MITQERLKELLHYDPETGLFTWKVRASSRVRAGDIAGRDDGNGYIRITIEGTAYLAHRLAFLYVEGSFPPDMADHINMARDDNRWCNLRPATRAQNRMNAPANKNSTIGIRGISTTKSGKFEARIRIGAKLKYLGTFPTPEEAHAAYMRAANENHGEFARAA